MAKLSRAEIISQLDNIRYRSMTGQLGNGVRLDNLPDNEFIIRLIGGESGFDSEVQAKRDDGRAGGMGIAQLINSTTQNYAKKLGYRDWETDRKSTRLNSSHSAKSRMPSSA